MDFMVVKLMALTALAENFGKILNKWANVQNSKFINAAFTKNL